MQIFCHSPQIILIKDFLSPAECNELIELARPKLLKSTVVNPQTGIREEHTARTSSGTCFSLNETKLILTIEQKIEKLTNWPMDCAEGLHILNYQVGGEYRRHFDYFDPALPGSSTHLARAGQRFATVILYLNTPDSEGATHFPRLNITVPATAGSALFFSNVKDDLTVDPLSEHAGLPVVSGEKWIATKWLRERKFN